MNKQSITFSANEQTLEKTGGIDNYASNIVSYVEATFTLGENWTGYDVVRAVWESAYAKISTVLDSDHKCVVPAEVLRHKSKVNVNLVGSIVTNDVLTDRLTTYPVHAITVDADARVDSTETQPITPSQFEQFVEAVHADAESIQDYSYDSEAWAKGTRGGVAVPSTDPTYHNNSKYYADQGAELEQEVSDLKSDINDGKEITLKGYWAESWTSGIGANIYKSDSIIIPAGMLLENVRFKANAAPTFEGYIYVLDENDKILDKFSLPAPSTSWETYAINKKYAVDAYIAVSGLSIANTYSGTEQSAMYSVGLYEASSTENSKGVGDTITFAHNVPTRYYSFAVDATYKTAGLTTRVTALEDTVGEIDGKINPSNYIMPLVIKKTGTYTLIGRWFDHQLDADRFKNCCNCGGQSIMFKVKGASTITANFGQVSRYPDNEDFLMVNEPYMAYSIDGSAFTRVQLDTTNGNSISVPDTNEHFVWIVIDGMDMTTKNGVNRDTGWIGVYIKSLTSNGTMYAVEPKNKQILFVGDSMVEGINTLGTDSKSPSNSAVAEFSFKTAQKLNAIPLLNGYGGSTTWTGVNWVRYSFGTTDTNVTTMTPDLIVIEYGHNDYSVISGGTKTVAEFISEYELLISILRGMYTGTPILCVVPFHQYLRSAIETVVSNTDCCYLIDTSSYSVTYSDGTHPDAIGATSIAESLSEDIIKIMGKGYFV